MIFKTRKGHLKCSNCDKGISVGQYGQCQKIETFFKCSECTNGINFSTM